MLDTGSLQIFANPCKFASQLCQKKVYNNAFPFFGKLSLPQTLYFTISNFLYKLTQPNIHTKTPELCPHHFKQSTLARVSVAEPNYFSSAPAPDFFFQLQLQKKNYLFLYFTAGRVNKYYLLY